MNMHLTLHVEKRVQELEEGKFEKEIQQLMKVDEKKLKKIYDERDIEEA